MSSICMWRFQNSTPSLNRKHKRWLRRKTNHKICFAEDCYRFFPFIVFFRLQLTSEILGNVHINQKARGYYILPRSTLTSFVFFFFFFWLFPLDEYIHFKFCISLKCLHPFGSIWDNYSFLYSMYFWISSLRLFPRSSGVVHQKCRLWYRLPAGPCVDGPKVWPRGVNPGEGGDLSCGSDTVYIYIYNRNPDWTTHCEHVQYNIDVY